MSRRRTVLVLDGELRHAIDIVRSLGGHGFRVVVTSSQRRAVTRFSRHTDTFIWDGGGEHSVLERVGFVGELVRRHEVDVVVAAGLKGLQVLSEGREQLGEVTHLEAPSRAAFATAEDKWETVELARRAGVPAPVTRRPAGPSALGECADMTFPVVVKARGGQGHFGYAHSMRELCAVYGSLLEEVADQTAADRWPLVQEYVPGTAHGFYALARDGEVVNWFMHRRLREVPPSGGPSSLACTFYDPRLLECGGALLRELAWSGVAMVEFKLDDRDGEFKLIEINPKFWGSLGLAIAAGVDFPYLLVRQALGEPPVRTPTTDSAPPVTYQWLTMDVAHSWAVRRPLLWLGPILHGQPNDFRREDPLPNAVLFVQRVIDVALGRRRVQAAGERP